jgi:hypothetical protein
MDELTTAWLSDLERRHLADLTLSEVARALRALSSCYVERRSRLASGDALASRGKRAAFALFYGPLHFLVTREVVGAIAAATQGLSDLLDLGCGTGAAGIAWATQARVTRIRGFDRHPWAVEEANLAYRLFRLDGRAVRRDIARQDDRSQRVGRLAAGTGTGIIAAYTLNELDNASRDAMLPQLLEMRRRGARLLVIEPIARRTAPWWQTWAAAFEAAGGRADEWRFATPLPPTQQQLARAAGLDPRELTARSIFA